MADILIRGMEMPKNCSSCKIICWNYLEYGINGILAKLSTSESRDPNCPLVPLPEGHGRLGDLDALAERCDSPHWCVWLNEIQDAPTIVPAEGGTE